jgi:hypothetical protein
MSKAIYGFYSCDAWRSYDSMDLIGVTSSLTKLKRALINGVKDESIPCTNFRSNDGDISISEKIRLLKIELKRVTTINDLLDMYQSHFDNVFIQSLNIL